MKTDVLDALFDARDKVSDLIVHVTPSADPERRAQDKSQLDALLRRRDRISGAINSVIEATFHRAGADLDAAIEDLHRQTAQLNKLAETIAGVVSAIGAIDALLGLIAQIVVMAAGA